MNKLVPYIFLFSSLLLGCGADEESNSYEPIAAAMEQKQYNQALQLIKASPPKQQGEPVMIYYKAECEYQNKMYEAAIQTTTSALQSIEKEDTLYPQLLFVRALSYTLSGEINLGIRDNETLVREYPDNLDHLINMSYLYGQAQRYASCLTVLKKAHTMDSLNIFVLNNLAYYSNQMHDYASAISYANMGIELTDDSIWLGTLLNSLGYAQSIIVEPATGLETIAQSIRYFPKNPYAYYNRGLIYVEKNSLDTACLNFKKAKELGGIDLTGNVLKKYCE